MTPRRDEASAPFPSPDPSSTPGDKTTIQIRDPSASATVRNLAHIGVSAIQLSLCIATQFNSIQSIYSSRSTSSSTTLLLFGFETALGGALGGCHRPSTLVATSAHADASGAAQAAVSGAADDDNVDDDGTADVSRSAAAGSRVKVS